MGEALGGFTYFLDYYTLTHCITISAVNGSRGSSGTHTSVENISTKLLEVQGLPRHIRWHLLCHASPPKCCLPSCCRNTPDDTLAISAVLRLCPLALNRVLTLWELWQQNPLRREILHSILVGCRQQSNLMVLDISPGTRLYVGLSCT